VVRGEVPAAIRKNVELWIGCVAGALADREYLAKLAAAGFENAAIEITREYKLDDARDFLADKGLDADALAREIDGKFASAFIRATKPMAAGATAEKAAVKAAAGENAGCCGQREAAKPARRSCC
jgi:hypothetical protein